MDAELFDIKGNWSQASEKYKESIKEASDRGLIRDQAVANHRFSEFWARQRNFIQARLHLDEAIDWYEAWGARAVAEDLRSKVAGLLPLEQQLPHKETAPSVASSYNGS